MIRRPPRSTRTDTPFPTRRSSDLEGRHEMRPGPCAGGSCAPGGRPAAGMDDVDALLGYRAGQPVDVATHDQGVLGVERHREMHRTDAFEVAPHRPAGRPAEGPGSEEEPRGKEGYRTGKARWWP